MKLPIFYKEDINENAESIFLDENTSKHIVQVLRMTIGEQLQLTNGKGNLYTVIIADDNRKKAAIKILSSIAHRPPAKKNTIGISLLKNSSRFEWLLEKATELGISEIIPLICERTEKQHFRTDRMKNILISAMLQSQQTWLPVLNEPVKFTDIVTKISGEQKFIAHCEDSKSKKKLSGDFHPFNNVTILIGPEGDFTKDEIEAALQNNFIPVSLGDTRLRTETAGMVAATILHMN